MLRDDEARVGMVAGVLEVVAREALVPPLRCHRELPAAGAARCGAGAEETKGRASQHLRARKPFGNFRKFVADDAEWRGLRRLTRARAGTTDALEPPRTLPATSTSLPSVSVSMSEPRRSARTPAKTKATDADDDQQMTSPARATRRATAKTPAKTPARSTRASAKKDKPHKPKDPVGFLLKYLLVVILFIGVARVFNGPFPMEIRLKENIAAKRAELFERAEQARATKEKIQTTTPLVFAAGEGDIDEVRRLLDAGHDVMERTAAGETPLHVSGIRGAPEVVEALLLAGADPNARTNGGAFLKMTPLHWMTHGGHVDGMRLLLEHGANPNLQNVRGETPVDVAARMAPHGGREELILLAEHGGKSARELGEAPPADDPPAEPEPAAVSEPEPEPAAVSEPEPAPGRAADSSEDTIDRAARADVTLEGEEDVSEAQRAKRERAQRLMRQFQEQAEELKRLHAQAMASKPDEL